MRRRIPYYLLAFALLLFECSAKTPTVEALDLLRKDLDSIFSHKDFSGARWSVEVFSLSRSEKLYGRDSSQLCIPASNNKIITAVVALLRLGPDYQFKTRVLTDGKIEGGALQGNLIIVGAGDPSISPLFQAGDPFVLFRDWANKLKERNIHAISGDIIGDQGAFEEIPYGRGWEWDDLIRAYAAQVSALQFNENLIALKITPGLKKGDAASVEASPLTDYFVLNNNISTGEEHSLPDIQIRRSDSSERIQLQGSIPLKNPGISQNVSVEFPARYYLSALMQVLREEGIDLSKAGIREARNFNAPSASLLWTQPSPALSDIMKPLLKESSNLGAETLARTLGLELRGEGSFSKGREIVEEELGKMGIDKNSYQYGDASGLSRRNLANAAMLVQVLKSIYQDRRFPYFYNALPIAGCDGTLANRMKKTAAADNVRAKTGSLSNISAISGYVRTVEGELLAFSIIINNFLTSRSKVESAQDVAIERLANFSRK